jgi:low affinity Fe/Cu permease
MRGGSAASPEKPALGDKVPVRSMNAELACRRRIEAVWRPAAWKIERHMARARTTSKSKKPATVRALRPNVDKSSGACEPTKKNSWSEMFTVAACATAHWAGKPVAFLTATGLVIAWALTGPLFGYSDTWQLVINTSTTIVTFLMVFLIQNTQNRDTMALQLKLSELILASDAENRFAKAEDLSDEELEQLHRELSKQAEETLDHLNERRSSVTKKAS